MLRRIVARFGPWLLGCAYVVAVGLFLAATVLTFSQQAKVNAELCQSTIENRAADRIQWLTLERLLVSATDDPMRQAAYHALIAGVLRPIPPLECVDDKPVPREA